MGFPMATHIHNKTHHKLYVFNRTETKEKEFISQVGGQSFRELTRPSEIFDYAIICLKDDDAILDTLETYKVMDYLKKDAVIIDHSTTSLNLVDRILSNKKFIQKRIGFLDAPVSGGESGAIKGVLTTMVGGNEDNLKIATEVIFAYTKSIVHIGKNGHGQIAKMINQICIAGILQGLAEALVFGRSQNVDMQKVIKAISGGAAQSWQLDNRALTMLSEEFNFGFAIDLMIKDLEIIKQSQPKDISSLKLTLDVLSKYKDLSRKGMGRLDTSVLIKSLQS